MIERGLSKETNHNVLLVGDNGVGKSTLISYLGRLGQSGLSFPGVRNHRIVELTLEGLSLSDFDKCLQEAANAGNVIVVLENIHAYEMLYERLVPYLHMPHLGIIATTDLSNYDQVLKNHPEFLSKIGSTPGNRAAFGSLDSQSKRTGKISFNFGRTANLGQNYHRGRCAANSLRQDQYADRGNRGGRAESFSRIGGLDEEKNCRAV